MDTKMTWHGILWHGMAWFCSKLLVTQLHVLTPDSDFKPIYRFNWFWSCYWYFASFHCKPSNPLILTYSAVLAFGLLLKCPFQMFNVRRALIPHSTIYFQTWKWASESEVWRYSIVRYKWWLKVINKKKFIRLFLVRLPKVKMAFQISAILWLTQYLFLFLPLYLQY